jgi:hypothetical protein
MKRSITLVLAVVFTLAAVSAFAATPAAKTHKPMGTELKGTISSIDDSAKSFVLDSNGKSNTISWTSATKVHGGPLKATESVVVRAMEKDGKWIATSVKVEAPKTATTSKK